MFERADTRCDKTRGDLPPWKVCNSHREGESMEGTNGRSSPHNREAERAVLGSILRDNGNLHRAMQLISGDDFYVYAHKLIFQALVDVIIEEGAQADVVTLADHLHRLNSIQDIGGYAYLTEIWDGAPATDNVLHYAAIVRDRAKHRSLLHTLHELQQQAAAPGKRPGELLEEARDRLLRHAAEAIMVDPGMLVLPVLCSVGGMIGNRYVCKVKSDWYEPAIFWGAVVAKSSTKKTPCFEAATAPIGHIQEEME